MRIVHVGAELAPLVKVGGLGDVVQGLSSAQIALRHNVEVIIPKYDVIEGAISVTALEVGDFFNRGRVYGCSDDPERFLAFCRAVVGYLEGSPPDVLHIHDWHAAALAPLVKRERSWETRIVYTIHNWAYKGECAPELLAPLGLKESLMEGGIRYADHVTTVSPTYAREIGREPLLSEIGEKFSGVLNGIDYAYWNPASDSHLPTHFSADDRSGKRAVKRALCERLGLAEEERPLVAAITRLVPQKGPELIRDALLHTLELGGQFVLLGSALDPAIQAEFENLKRTLEGSHHVHLELEFNEALSHLVFGASDLFLVPSIFEPCGLTQMIAMRYGAVPLVRQTGGLADTVFEGENGFVFEQPNREAICGALERAFHTWGTAGWEQLVSTGMHTDFSWDRPAEEYLKLYGGVSGDSRAHFPCP